jgi:hypothetical protein
LGGGMAGVGGGAVAVGGRGMLEGRFS